MSGNNRYFTMLNKKEIISISVISIILAFAISLIESLEFFIYTLLMVVLMILVNVFAKKATSYYLDSEIEVKIWEIKRTGIMHFMDIIPFHTTHPSTELKKPFSAGAFLPIITVIISLGNITWMGNLIFDVKAKIYRAAKRHGLYTFSEMTESHIGLIASAGIIANLGLAIIAYLIGFPDFAKLNIFYTLFNILPISDLDGNKIFFGSLVLWSFLAALVLIGMGYVFLVI